MRWKMPGIPARILLALLLGAAFGAILHVDDRALTIDTRTSGSIALTEWDSLRIESTSRQRQFSSSEGRAVVTLAAQHTGERFSVRVLRHQTWERYDEVTAIRRTGTLATAIKPVGDIFIRLLMMISIPLVFASLFTGVAGLKDIRRMARIGTRTLSYYLVTTAIAITIGVTLTTLIAPGHHMDAESRDRLLSSYHMDAASRIDQHLDFSLGDFLLSIVPKNVFAALANGEMLPIIFFALMLGGAAVLIPDDKRDRLVSFFDALTDAMIRLVEGVMSIAPFAVFALIAAVVAEFGFSVLGTLVWYMATLLLGLLVHTVVTYPLALKLFVRRFSVRRFFRDIRPAQLVAFSTSSSAATLPVNFECCERMGVPRGISGFVLPLGATVNMDGTAMYQGVATVFIAQVFGMDLTLGQQLTVVLTATLASIGTAPVPAVGIIMLLIVLRSVGVPEEGIALILGVDRFLDMCRTVPNITGDASAAVIVAGAEGVLAREIPESPSRSAS